MEIDQKVAFHSIKKEEAEAKLNTRKKGLSSKEARERLHQYGRNKLKEKEEKSALQILISQMNNPVVYLLSAAAVLAFVFGDIPEGIAIVVVLVLNALIGFWMEYQAHESMKALKKMDKILANVRRDDKELEIDAEELVPGDIIILEQGNMIPADARVILSSELSVDESPLTGESVPVEKDVAEVEEDTPVADRSNMIFKGTAVTSGKGEAMVTATGMQTELGNISQMVSEAEDEKVPLNRKLQGLTKSLIWVTLGLAAVFLLFGWIAGKELYLLAQTAIAWTVAAIPEGLPIVASIALARGMIRLSRHNVIVKKLASVETLGETTVIFTDKTGTLTENKLTVNVLKVSDNTLKIKFQDGTIKMDPGDPGLENPLFKKIFEISILCNDAALQADEGQEKDEGDPLEIALLRFGHVYNKKEYDQLSDLERVAEDPFDSETKVMGTIHRQNNKFIVSAKGAAESLLNRCSHIHDGKQKKKLDKKKIEEWSNYNDELSNDGLRVVAFAYKEMDEVPKPIREGEQEFLEDLVFIGLVGFIDPPRQEVAASVKECHQAGVEVVMVTGDHPGTARNIAENVNIIEEGESKNVFTGKQLKKESEKDDNLEEITKTRVFARVNPAQKLDIINYFKKKGAIVGMTGDGVNDAPALKKADIGIAMGNRGTQVAQEVADMVLKDDSFPSIVKAIEQGRIIFGNIRRFVIYQLSYHLSEILVIASISFSLFYLPLLPLQLLFLNLLSDVFPALALGIGKGNPGVMKTPPKDPAEPIITRRNWIMMGIFGLIITIYVDGAYFLAYFGWGLSSEVCNNIAFFSLALAQFWHVFNMRESYEPVFNNQVTRNKYVWMAISFTTVVLISSYFIPGLRDVLSYQELSPRIWMLIIITSLAPLVTIQLFKQLSKRF